MGRGKLILKRSEFTEGKGRLKSLKCSRFNSVPFNHQDWMSLILADTKLRKTETRWWSRRFLYWFLKQHWQAWREVKQTYMRKLCEESTNKLQPVSEEFQSTEVFGGCMVTVTGKHNTLWKEIPFSVKLSLGFCSHLFPFPPAGVSQTLKHNKNSQIHVRLGFFFRVRVNEKSSIARHHKVIQRYSSINSSWPYLMEPWKVHCQVKFVPTLKKKKLKKKFSNS